MLRTLFITCIFALSTLGVVAQKGDRKWDESKIEEHQKRQAEFFIKELNLDEKQQKEFIPLMQTYTKDRFELNKSLRSEMRALKQKEKPSDDEYKKVIKQIVDTKEKEASLQKDFFNKMSKILTPEQAYKYSVSEVSYMRHVMDKHKGAGKGDKSRKAKGEGRGPKSEHCADCPMKSK